MKKHITLVLLATLLIALLPAAPIANAQDEPSYFLILKDGSRHYLVDANQHVAGVGFEQDYSTLVSDDTLDMYKADMQNQHLSVVALLLRDGTVTLSDALLADASTFLIFDGTKVIQQPYVDDQFGASGCATIQLDAMPLWIGGASLTVNSTVEGLCLAGTEYISKAGGAYALKGGATLEFASTFQAPRNAAAQYVLADYLSILEQHTVRQTTGLHIGSSGEVNIVGPAKVGKNDEFTVCSDSAVALTGSGSILVEAGGVLLNAGELVMDLARLDGQNATPLAVSGTFINEGVVRAAGTAAPGGPAAIHVAMKRAFANRPGGTIEVGAAASLEITGTSAASNAGGIAGEGALLIGMSGATGVQFVNTGTIGTAISVAQGSSLDTSSGAVDKGRIDADSLSRVVLPAVEDHTPFEEDTKAEGNTSGEEEKKKDKEEEIAEGNNTPANTAPAYSPARGGVSIGSQPAAADGLTRMLGAGTLHTADFIGGMESTIADAESGSYRSIATQLYVRSEAGQDGAVVGKIPMNTLLLIAETTGDGWGYVALPDGTKGWVSMAYVVPIGPKTKGSHTTAANLRMRTGPGTNYASTGIAPAGTVVETTGFVGEWAVVRRNGADVYMHSAYLR